MDIQGIFCFVLFCFVFWLLWGEVIPSGGNCLSQGLEAGEYSWCSILKVICSVRRRRGGRASSGSLRNLDFIL